MSARKKTYFRLVFHFRFLFVYDTHKWTFFALFNFNWKSCQCSWKTFMFSRKFETAEKAKNKLLERKLCCFISIIISALLHNDEFSQRNGTELCIKKQKSLDLLGENFHAVNFFYVFRWHRKKEEIKTRVKWNVCYKVSKTYSWI